MVPVFIPQAVTASFEKEGIKGTFTDGFVPIHIDLSPLDKRNVRIISLNISLCVTWYKPSRTVWLCFDSQQKAECARKFFETSTYGTPATVQVSKPGSEWLLVVNGVQPRVRQTDLLDALPPEGAAVDIFFGKITYSDKIRAIDQVRRQIQKHTSAAIITEGHRPKKNALKSCSLFSFAEKSNVEGLVTALDGLKVPELGDTELHARQSLVLTLGVKMKVFKEKRAGLKSLEAESWKSSKVKIVWTAPNTNEIIVNIFASQRDALALVKRQLSDLFREDQAPQISANFGMSQKPQAHRIWLTKTTAYKEARDAMDQMREAFGAEVVALDEDSDPEAVIVKGDTAMLRHVQKYLSGEKPLPKSKTITCSMCLEEDVEDCVKLKGCGHVGCKGCVVAFCTINPSEGVREFPLRCFNPECRASLPLPQIYGLLSGDQFWTLMTDSLDSHLRSHRNKYIPCPDKECPKIHGKKAKNSGKQLCERCLVGFCGHCGSEFHYGLSCKEYQKKVVEDEQGLQRWIEEAGAKNCPNCTAIVEKEEGCNNMHCSACNAHFCWVCLEMAETHQGVYGHLMRKHGGYFDDEIAQMAELVRNMDPAEAALNHDFFGNGIADIRPVFFPHELQRAWAHDGGFDARFPAPPDVQEGAQQPLPPQEIIDFDVRPPRRLPPPVVELQGQHQPYHRRPAEPEIPREDALPVRPRPGPAQQPGLPPRPAEDPIPLHEDAENLGQQPPPALEPQPPLAQGVIGMLRRVLPLRRQQDR